MLTLLLFCAYAISFAELSDTYCCSEEQGIVRQLQDYQNVCFNSVTNITTPINRLLACNKMVSVTNAEIDLSEFIKIMEAENELYCIANETSELAERVVFGCRPEEEPGPIVEAHVLARCMFVSVVFLVPTVLVYSILPEIRDLQGKSITHLCGCLAAALLILGIMNTITAPNFETCAVEAFLVYLFFMAAFFWMNAISIQILRNIRRPTISDYGWKQFLWYALYAYGVPVLLTGAMAIVNYHPGDHSKPGIGLQSCWFYSKKQQWYYMYSVMSVLIAANICIFIYTSIYLWRGSFSSSHVKALRYRFLMSVRLLVIMGLPWTFEMMSSLSPPHIIWTIFDVLNMLQGPLIFLVLVVLRRRVVKALYKRGCLNCISGLVERRLAVGDDEEDVVEHTTAEALEFNDKN